MISVCMATYNGAKYLKEQVDSILMQLNETDELIISDDGSTDNTIEILKSYNDTRIKIFYHCKIIQKYSFGYTTLNFENALCHANGDYIFLADQDDVWLPTKIEIMVDQLYSCDIVLSDCSFVDSELNLLVKSKFDFEGVRIGAMRNIYKCKYLGSSMAFKCWLLPYILPFQKNVPHDLWIGLVGGYVGRFELLDSITMLYRRHENNVSATNNALLDKQKNGNNVRMVKNSNSISFKLVYRMNTMLAFLKFIFSKKQSKNA